MRLLSTLYVTEHRATISVRKGSVLVTTSDDATKVPIEGLDAVVILGGAQMTMQAIDSCVNRGVRVSALRRSGRVRFVVSAGTRGNVQLRMAQIEAAADREHCAALARWFVAGKLQNCRRMAGRWMRDAKEPERTAMHQARRRLADSIRALSDETDGDRIRGIEGEGTRRYFKCLGACLHGAQTGLAFMARTRRPPRDPVNATLSFVYGLLTTELAGAIDAIGLDPQIGFLHHTRPGRPALALDILEELRPSIADRFAVRLINRRILREEHFVSTPGGACYLGDAGRRTLLEHFESFKGDSVPHRLLDRDVPRWSIPGTQVTLLARYLRGDLPAYPPYVMTS